MNTNENKILSWHQPVWEQFFGTQEKLPHAILLYGPKGIGKKRFAAHLAQSLLCENRQDDGSACLACAACNWFSQEVHPDYRFILPDALNTGSKNADDEKPASRSGSAASKWITIDQIRNLNDMINVSTYRGGYRVICIWPADALRMESSNALLKMLEEPPENTIFVLVANNISALLPTILSRCRKIAMPSPDFQTALSWLKEQEVDDAEIWLAEQGGFPITALKEAQNGSRAEMDLFFQALMTPSTDTALKTADRLQGISAANVISWLQKWLYDLLSLRMSGQVRYFLRYQKVLEKQALAVNLDELLRMIRKTAKRKQVAEHPLALRLLIDDMLLDYARLFS